MRKSINVKTSLNVVPKDILKPAIPVIVIGAAAKFTVKVGGQFNKLAKVIFEFNQGDNVEVDDNRHQFSAFNLENGVPSWNEEYIDRGISFEGTIEYGEITEISLKASSLFTETLFENDLQDLMEYNIIVVYKDQKVPTVIKKQPSILVISGNSDERVIVSPNTLI